MIHIVLNGVPSGAKGTLGTIRIIRDDIDTRNLRHTIHRQMIVSDATPLLLGEETAKAYGLSSTPHTIDNTTGIMEGELLLIKLCALTSHHIEQDAITSLIAINMRIGSPILRTKRPSIATIRSAVPLWRPPILCIETDKVDANIYVYGGRFTVYR